MLLTEPTDIRANITAVACHSIVHSQQIFNVFFLVQSRSQQKPGHHKWRTVIAALGVPEAPEAGQGHIYAILCMHDNAEGQRAVRPGAVRASSVSSAATGQDIIIRSWWRSLRPSIGPSIVDCHYAAAAAAVAVAAGQYALLSVRCPAASCNCYRAAVVAASQPLLAGDVVVFS
jgi:hypothetical protein